MNRIAMKSNSQKGLLHPEYESSIPENSEAKQVCDYRKEFSDDGMSGAIWTRNIEYYVNGKLVGKRCYGSDGLLWSESGLNEHGQMHGWHYEFESFDEGHLQCKEYYDKGLLHGKCKQWSGERFIGDYTLEYGTGYDLWRHIDEEGNSTLSEIYQLKDGMPHGYFWRVANDLHEVWSEEHYYEGSLHGIRRQWNFEGRLSRSFPQYYINNEKVDKRKYLRASAKDETLSPFREEDQLPQRLFTPFIQKVILEDSKRSQDLKSRSHL